MAISFVQSKSANAGGVSSTAPSAVFTSTPTVNNLLVAAVYVQSATAITMSSTGWIALTSATGGSLGTARAIRLFYKIAGVGESTTVTATGGSATWVIAIAEYSGISRDNPLRTENSQVNATNTIQATPTITATPSNILVVAMSGNNNTANTFSSEQVNSLTANVNEREDSTATSNVAAVYYDQLIIAPTGSYVAQATQSGGTVVGAGAIAVFNGLAIQLNNYQQLDVGDGMSTSEKIR